MADSTTVISTWFVADRPEEATFFPQTGLRSDDLRSQATYWRCVACFYVVSRGHNPGARHVFFTNADLPVVEGLSIAALFEALSVETVKLPIETRIRRDEIKSWGNQFYILDILRYLSRHQLADRYLVLDSDCLFRRPVDALLPSLDREGVLTYEVGYAGDKQVNGSSGADIARSLKRVSGIDRPKIPYLGGEFFAATSAQVEAIVDRSDILWAEIAAGRDEEIREEAHFLSVIYAWNGYAVGTANAFIRRMWTALSFNNLRDDDRQLMIWHLPAEKKTGFRRLFRLVPRQPAAQSRLVGHPFLDDEIGRLMGVPRRNALKWMQDLAYKLREKLNG